MLPDKPVLPANTTVDTSPNDPVSAKGIRPTHQCAMNAKDRLCDSHMPPYPVGYGYHMGGMSLESWEDRVRDEKYVATVDRHLNRGGSTFVPGDGIENY